jgi:hypothetical protein
MLRRVYRAVLGIVAGVFLSVWVAPFACAIVGMFYSPEDREKPFVVAATISAILCGLAGLVFGIRWGGYRLEGRSKRQGFAAIAGGIVGIPCGIVLAILSGFLKSVMFTVPGCFFLGILLGAMLHGAKQMAPEAKQDAGGNEGKE